MCPNGVDGGPAPSTRREVVRARGHENVAAAHESTLEVTTDDWLTPAGDCILAVDADRAPADFDAAFVAACRDPGARITATLQVTPADAEDAGAGSAVHEASVTGRGHPELTFDSERSAVCRTSEYVDDRTVMVDAGRAAADLDRDLVSALSGPDVDLLFELTVDPAGSSAGR